MKTEVERLATFAVRARYEQIPDAARTQLKVRILDALACAIGALGSGVVGAIRRVEQTIGPGTGCTLIGGGVAAPDRAAFVNSALVRYLDFNDSFLAPGETCHPSDNLGGVLAACEYAGATGRDLLASLAVSYQVQCRLSEEAPVRAKGFDHTTQGSYALAAGISRALRLEEDGAANAISISGTAFNALRVTRTGALSNWKGLAYPNTAFGVMHAALLARAGITGPREVFEGNKGFMDAIAGRFAIDWEREPLDIVTRTIVKRYNAEIHSQSAIEGILELARAGGLRPSEVERIELETFEVAWNIIGGGEEGDKRRVRTKEEADHSLPYLLAVAVLDGEVGPRQYAPERIGADDAQRLLAKVEVRPSTELSRRFPGEMPARISVTLRDGTVLRRQQSDYEGFVTRPMSWESVARKLESLAGSRADARLRAAIVDAVDRLEAIDVRELTGLLARVRQEV